MTGFDLRPLSLGEILDRTFTLYRKHFALFIGIAAIPQLFVLALSLGMPFAISRPGARTIAMGVSGMFSATSIIVLVVTAIVAMVAYLFAQGGSVFAVSEIYLGRQTTIGQALGKVRGNLGFLFGVMLLNGLVVGLATILLIVPGIFMACRLCTCVPCALIEEKGPRDSLSRSFSLTKGFAWRAFMIFALYLAISMAAGLLFSAPFSALLLTAAHDPSMVRVWTSLAQVGSSIATVLATPILTIATAIFYYDLRVRKEAFDIQFMMNPELMPASPSSMPSIL